MCQQFTCVYSFLTLHVRQGKEICSPICTVGSKLFHPGDLIPCQPIDRISNYSFPCVMDPKICPEAQWWKYQQQDQTNLRYYIPEGWCYFKSCHSPGTPLSTLLVDPFALRHNSQFSLHDTILVSITAAQCSCNCKTTAK